MESAFWGQLAAPFMAVAMLAIAYPIKRLVWRHMKDGPLKRLLFKRLS